MKWIITYYSEKVIDELARWPRKLKAKFLRILDLIEEHGLNPGVPMIKPKGNGLFEIRVKAQEGIGRVFFCFVFNKEIVLLHSFIKKTQKTPKKELEIAIKRMMGVQKS